MTPAALEALGRRLQMRALASAQNTPAIPGRFSFAVSRNQIFGLF
jgi:hypothetical protein